MQEPCVCVSMIIRIPHEHFIVLGISLLILLFYQVLFSQTFLVGKVEECLENVGVWAWGGGSHCVSYQALSTGHGHNEGSDTQKIEHSEQNRGEES